MVKQDQIHYGNVNIDNLGDEKNRSAIRYARGFGPKDL